MTMFNSYFVPKGNIATKITLGAYGVTKNSIRMARPRITKTKNNQGSRLDMNEYNLSQSLSKYSGQTVNNVNIY